MQPHAIVLAKLQDDLVLDLPRIPYIDDVYARATVDAMQAEGLPLPKVDVKSLFDNSLLKTIEAEFRARSTPVGLPDSMIPTLLSIA
jgi:hypothetical protein